jgi:hypothetical protein
MFEMVFCLPFSVFCFRQTMHRVGRALPAKIKRVSLMAGNARPTKQVPKFSRSQVVLGNEFGAKAQLGHIISVPKPSLGTRGQWWHFPACAHAGSSLQLPKLTTDY